VHAANTGAQFRRQAHHRCSHRGRTPQYSADLDPIEMAFAKLKAPLRKRRPISDSGTELVP
jgi:transposase